MAQLVKNPPAMQEIWVPSQVGKIPWRKEQLPTPVFWPGEFHGLFHGVAKSQTQLSTFHTLTKRADKERSDASLKVPCTGGAFVQ